MVIKKDLIIAVLATFCLTATLFMITPTNSMSTTSTGKYDPWIDTDDDGDIDIYDVVRMCNVYGTKGDPSKNVRVTNFPLDENGNLRVSIPDTLSQVHKESVEIRILDWSMRYKYYPIGDDHLEQGILCTGYGSVFIVLPFVFNPKEAFLNVTNVWVTFVMSDDSGTTGYGGRVFYNITINEQNTLPRESPIISGHMQAISVHLENSSICNTICPTINTVSLELDHIEIDEIPQQNWYKMWVYTMTIIIEYEYLA